MARYKPQMNVELYRVQDRVDLSLGQTAVTREILDLYYDFEFFGGLVFVFDNHAKIIYTYVTSADCRSWAKKISKATDQAKCAKLTQKYLQSEMEVNLSDYHFIRINEGEIHNEFEKTFLYAINPIEMYSQHYYRDDVQMLMPEEEPEVELSKCPTCGWILSSPGAACPRCKLKK